MSIVIKRCGEQNRMLNECACVCGSHRRMHILIHTRTFQIHIRAWAIYWEIAHVNAERKYVSSAVRACTCVFTRTLNDIWVRKSTWKVFVKIYERNVTCNTTIPTNTRTHAFELRQRTQSSIGTAQTKEGERESESKKHQHKYTHRVCIVDSGSNSTSNQPTLLCINYTQVSICRFSYILCVKVFTENNRIWCHFFIEIVVIIYCLLLMLLCCAVFIVFSLCFLRSSFIFIIYSRSGYLCLLFFLKKH